MKKTVWTLDSTDTELVYFHDSEEIFVRQDTRHSHGGQVYEVGLSVIEAGELEVALSQLQALIAAEKMSKLEDAA